jgi:hypothetical protein
LGGLPKCKTDRSNPKVFRQREAISIYQGIAIVKYGPLIPLGCNSLNPSDSAVAVVGTRKRTCPRILVPVWIVDLISKPGGLNSGI